MARIVLFLTLSLVLIACGATPSPTRSPRPTPEETPSIAPPPEASPTLEPGPTADPFLHVDGMATVVSDIDQIADPDHPNHAKENRKFDPLEAGTPVLLADKVTRKKDVYWQIYDGARTDGLIGWVPQLSGTELNLEPFQPACPTDFPLSAESMAELNSTHGASVACFGDTELTLSGAVTCNRPVIEYAVSGASYLDAQRSCFLGQEGDLYLYGSDIYDLLESPPVDSITGRYLIRGHFDDPEAQACFAIPFGTSPGVNPTEPPDPGSVMACRQMFVVSNVISTD